MVVVWWTELEAKDPSAVAEYGKGARRAISTNVVELYKMVFAPTLPPTIAHVGLFQVRVSHPSILPPPPPSTPALSYSLAPIHFFFVLRFILLSGHRQPLGAIMPMSEMQSRWIARVWAGRCESWCRVLLLCVFVYVGWRADVAWAGTG